jgi:hypothetical protein
MRNTIIVIWFFLPVFCVGQLMSSQTLNLRAELTSTGVKVDDPLSKQQIENLSVLGRTWGFLKYYHPVVAKGFYNFDSCLFNVLPPILTAKNKRKRDELLFHWINTLGDENKYPAAPPSTTVIFIRNQI